MKKQKVDVITRMTSKLYDLGKFSRGRVGMLQVEKSNKGAHYFENVSLTKNPAFWLEDLRAFGYDVISSEDLVRFRMDTGNGVGECVRDSVLYIPKEKEVWISNEPVWLSEPPGYCNEKHWGDYLLNQEQVDAFKEKGIKVDLKGYALKGSPWSDKYPSIPVKRIADDPITSLLFGKEAEEYVDYVSDQGIDDLAFIALDEEHFALDSSRTPFVKGIHHFHLNKSSMNLFWGNINGRCLCIKPNNDVPGYHGWAYD